MLQTPNELRKELSPAVMRRLEEIVSAVNQLEQRLGQFRSQPTQASQQQVVEAVRGLLGPYAQRILGDASASDPLLTEIGTLPGAVTSIAVAAPTQFAIAGSPITGSGTITISWNTQTANTVLAGPTGGAPAVPTFRALVDADIPDALTISGGTVNNTPIGAVTASTVRGTTINSTSSEFQANGTKVVGAQGAAVADAAGGATIDAEARTALNALLARLRTHGLIAT